jgi:hypothetical protein
VTIDGYCHHYRGASSFFSFGLIIVEGIVCFLYDVLVNEDEIVELEANEGTKNIN